VPTCPVCGNKVSLFQWDIFAGGCTACTGVNPDAIENLLSQPCPECGGQTTFATTAPALACVRTRHGVVPTKTGPGLYILGCADCGHAWFRFTSAGAAALADTPGWIGQRQVSKLRGQPSFNCPTCGHPIDLKTPTGIRISDDEPWRVYCERCNEELGRDT
jgi:hypothetical protein